MANYIKKIAEGCCLCCSNGNNSSKEYVITAVFNIQEDENSNDPLTVVIYNPYIYGNMRVKKIEIDGLSIDLLQLYDAGGYYTFSDYGRYTVTYTLTLEEGGNNNENS